MNPAEPAGDGVQLLEPFCWGLDPLYWTHVKIFASQIRTIISAPGIPNSHFLRIGKGPCRPILHVEVVGTVVRIQNSGAICKYTLDDGTGFFHCYIFSNGNFGDEEETVRQKIAIGVTAKIRGKLQIAKQEFVERDVLMKDDPGPHREIIVEEIGVVDDPNEEICAWAEIMNLCQNEYSVQAKAVTLHSNTKNVETMRQSR